MIDHIIILTGQDLVTFIEWINSLDRDPTHNLRIGYSEEGVKVKSNYGIWSRGLGAPE